MEDNKYTLYEKSNFIETFWPVETLTVPDGLNMNWQQIIDFFVQENPGCFTPGDLYAIKFNDPAGGFVVFKATKIPVKVEVEFIA